MIKLAFMINRVDGMSLQEFVEYHREHHAPLFTSIPEAQKYVRKYTVSHPIPTDKYPSAAFDGLTEIWFENWADHDAFFASKNYLELVRPDETFFERNSVKAMITEERS